jgi:hypothetical protein
MKRLQVVVGLVAMACMIAPVGCDLFLPAPGTDPNAQWLETFQTYPVASFPSQNWVKSGNADAEGNEVVWDPEVDQGHILQLKGVSGGNWAAGAYRAVDLSDLHHITFRVRVADVGAVGHHNYRAQVDLRVDSDWTAEGRRLILFGTDGNIRTSLDESPAPGEGLILGQYDLAEWYDVEIWYTRQSGTVELSYYINGEHAGTIEVDALASEPDLAYIGLWSGDTTAWFDDVGVSPTGHY